MKIMEILFVCTGNSFRSPVAEALTKKYKPELDVSSAGTAPATLIAPNGKKLLEKENARKLVKDHPQPLTAELVQSADRIIVMQEEHANFIRNTLQIDSHKIENWDIEDPINPDVDDYRAFQEIKEKVRRL